MHNWNWHGWFMPGMWFVWGPVVCVLVWFVIRQMPKSNIQTKGEEESPLEILKKRYARGEITSEEYEERKRVLSEK